MFHLFTINTFNAIYPKMYVNTNFVIYSGMKVLIVSKLSISHPVAMRICVYKASI